MNLYLFKEAIGVSSAYGIGSYIKELTHALEGADINIFIVHIFSERPKFEIETSNRVENWYVPKGPHDNSSSDTLQKIDYYCKNVAYLLRLYIKDTTDLVFHFNFNLCFALAKELKAVYTCKTVITVHYTNWHLMLNGHLSLFQKIKEKTKEQRNSFEQDIYLCGEKEKSLFLEVDRVIALSHYMLGVLENEYGLDKSRISVIPNGLDDAFPQSPVNKDVLLKKWNFSNKESLLLFAGRIDHVKGIIYLISAFRHVLSAYPNCRLIIAGNGDYDACIKEMTDTCAKITFTGFLEKKDLQELYYIANVGVVPSLHEPFGYVALEMMMFGLPVVATATSGLNEVVDDACGFKVPIMEFPDHLEIDTMLLSEKILFLLQHPIEARQSGQYARKRYKEFYSRDVYCNNMLNFYQSLY